MKQITHGFSLLELLITLGIICILSSIGYPSYRHHLVKVRRQQAKIELIKVVHTLQKNYAVNHQYQATSIQQASPFYIIQLTRIEPNHFKISAVPQHNQTDPLCNVLSIDETGKHHITGQGTVTQCWG